MHVSDIRQRLRDLGAGPKHEERVLRRWACAQPQDGGRRRLEDFMPQAVRAALPARACAGCAAALPECALECGACRAAAPACVVTGYPIARGAERACKACGSQAIAAFFDDLVKRTKVCPWCAAPS